MNKRLLRAYAKLIARRGLNVKKNQDVIVQTEVEQLEFINMVVEELYKAGARKVFVDDGNKFTPGVSAAISYFGLNYLHAKATAYFNCTDKTIPEFYLCNSNPDVNNETYWVSASDSNAYNGNYRKYNYANFQTLGNSSGAQTLTLNIASYTSRTVYLIISQHNSKKAGGGTDVYNPETNAFSSIKYNIYHTKEEIYNLMTKTKDYLYSYTIDFLEYLKKLNYEIIILTKGNDDYQKDNF